MKNSKNIWLVNIGEPLPIDGNRLHRMCAWKKQLEKEGYAIVFFTTDFEHRRKKWINNSPEGFYLLRSYVAYAGNISIKRLINHFLLSISLLRAFCKQTAKPDIILVSFPTILLSFVSVIYGRLKNIKVVVDVRDKWPDIFLIHPVLYLVVWPLFLLKRYVFRNSTILIAISPGYYRWALPQKDVDSNFILPLVQPSIQKLNRSLFLNKTIKLLFVGTLGITYNLEMLLTIHDALKRKKMDFEILVCGDGPRMKWLQENIVDRKLIKVYGWLSKSELQLKLNEAAFGLMLYYEDSPQGWPNKLIEYISNGLPIINTLKGESWDLIEQEKLGINVNSDGVVELVNWLDELIDNTTEYKNYVQRNYLVHEQYFTDASNFKKLLKIL